MKFLPILFLLMSITASATLIKTEEKGDIKKLYLDYNNDKKIDLIETYDKKELVKKEQDYDFDGSFEEVVEYFPYKSPTEPIEVIKKSDRLSKVYRNEKLNKIITTTEVDTDGDGKYDKTITGSEPLIQKRDINCAGAVTSITPAVSNLLGNMDKSLSKLSGGYYLGEPGYKVHKSCFDLWGAKTFASSLSKAKNEGLSCLANLASKNAPNKPNGALNNLNSLNRLYQQSPVSLVCHETDYTWPNTLGHASSNTTDKLKSLKINHPYLSLSPKVPATAQKPTADDVSELTRTIFHEQLHNLGIRHGEGVEYPYTCETCCLGDKKQSKELTDISCKICAGQYDTKNKKDVTYLKDFTVWAESTFQHSRAAKAINKFQQENPKSQWGIIMQARTTSNLFSPTGIEMAKILKKKFSSFSIEDNENLSKALTHEAQPHLKALAASAKPVAEANIDYYFDNDPRKAMATFEKNKAQLKEIVKNKKAGTNDNEKWSNETLYQDASTLLNAIFLKGYPDNVDQDSSTRAYNLMKEIGID